MRKGIKPEQEMQLLEGQLPHHLKHDHLGQTMTHLTLQFCSADHHFLTEEMNQTVTEFQIAPAPSMEKKHNAIKLDIRSKPVLSLYRLWNKFDITDFHYKVHF